MKPLSKFKLIQVSKDQELVLQCTNKTGISLDSRTYGSVNSFIAIIIAIK